MQDLPCCQCMSSPEDFQYFYTIDRADYELQNHIHDSMYAGTIETTDPEL